MHHFIFNLGFSATTEASLHIEIGILYLYRGIVSHFICTSQPPPRHNCTFKLYLLATIKIITQLNVHLSTTIKSLFTYFACLLLYEGQRSNTRWEVKTLRYIKLFSNPNETSIILYFPATSELTNEVPQSARVPF
jgi:hypothetical protein